MKALLLLLFLSFTSLAFGQYVEARYLWANELSRSGVIRIYPKSHHVTISSPLTVDVLAYNAKGELLKPSIGGAIDWASAIPKDVVLQEDIVTEIPIGTYKAGPVPCALADAIYRYNVDAISAVWLSIPIRLEKLGEKKVMVQVPDAEVRRLIGRRVGG